MGLSQVELAQSIATEAHAGQKRFGGEPFITHPQAVAASFDRNEDMAVRAAAWLHDVLEDTGRLTGDLRRAGVDEWIIGIVEGLTKKKDEEYTDYILRIAGYQSPEFRKVKIADLKHNLSTLPESSKCIKQKYRLALHILGGKQADEPNLETALERIENELDGTNIEVSGIADWQKEKLREILRKMIRGE